MTRKGRNAWSLRYGGQEFLLLLRPLCPHVRYCAVLIPSRTKPLHLEAALAWLLAQHIQGSMTQHCHILGHRQYGCDWRPRETSHPTPNARDSRCLNGCAPACSLVPHHHLFQQIGARFRRGRAVQRVFRFDKRHTLKFCLAVAFLQRIDGGYYIIRISGSAMTPLEQSGGLRIVF